MKPIITVKNLFKDFPDRKRHTVHALADINITINEGEFFIMLGPSGSGKSTLLRIMSGLEFASDGQVSYSPDIKPEHMSFVFQQFGLLPWLNVEENIGLNLISKKLPEHEKVKRVHRELEQLGLSEFRHAHISDLSGGMRQRVGIARALANDPKVIFMDEPFSELDSFTAAELRKDLLRIWRERTVTIIMVTHIVPDAVELGSRIAVLSVRPGTIKKVIDNTLPRPRHVRTAEFYAVEDIVTDLIKPHHGI
jgi:ABC-type nitrate/sulfonate/bicarbonate transport system ATPase subunit